MGSQISDEELAKRLAEEDYEEMDLEDLEDEEEEDSWEDDEESGLSYDYSKERNKRSIKLLKICKNIQNYNDFAIYPGSSIIYPGSIISSKRVINAIFSTPFI